MRRFYGSISAAGILLLILVAATSVHSASILPTRSGLHDVIAGGGTATPTCSPVGSYRILIAYSDSVAPSALQGQLLNEPGVTGVDFFNTRTGTPTLALMQQYSIVMTFSNATYSNATLLGNNLADYLDGGGVVVAASYAFVSGATNFSIQGRWLSGGYSPFVYGPNLFEDAGLGDYDASHPLMQGVVILADFSRSVLTLASGATLVASWTDGNPLLAYKGRAFGISGYLGNSPVDYSGQFSHVIVNTRRWLSPSPCAPTNTPTPTNTASPTRKPTRTPTRTAGPTGTDTVTPAPTSTSEATATPTNTLVATSTSTRTATTVSSPTSTTIASPTIAPTATIQPTSFSTATPLPTQTHVALTATTAPTRTAVPGTSTAMMATDTATATEVVPTVCTIQYADVLTDSEFYPYVECLACRGVASGYACGEPGEPCDANNDGYFRPFNNITRAQIAKMISNSAGIGEDPGPQIYVDVTAANTFYAFINRLTNRGHIGGYPCGGPGEPCDEIGRAYFRPFANASRGQISKIVSNAAGITDVIPESTQSYTDVPSSNPFWLYIERLTAHAVMGGYDCGGNAEPCDSQNRPYFRPFADVTRAQAAKIISNTFFPSCVASIPQASIPQV